MTENKQKVLIVHNYYQIPGGEDTVVSNEKKLLEKNGHEVVLYTRHNSELKSFSKMDKISLPFSTIFNLRTYKEIKEIIRKEKIEIVHVHNTLNLVSPSVYYAAVHSHVPVIQTVHNFRLLCPGATFFRDGHVCEDCLSKGLSCAVKNKCYRGSRIQTLACVVSTIIHRTLKIYGKLNYICLTEFNKEKLLHLKQIKERKVFVKPNFVEAAKEIVPYEQRKDQFVYVGRLEEIKGMDILLGAWKNMGENAPKLLMCGKGPLEEWCHTFINENKLENIEMLGFVPNEQVRELVGKSKALILPTQVYEGFPMTIAESFAAGTPVIGSDLGNTGSLIENGKNGWKFQPKSIKELAEAVQKIRESFEGLDDDMMSKYSAEKNYEQLRNIYEACCNHY
mgnify:CR=1 FL=1